MQQEIITAGEADLIGGTRLEDVPLAAYADREGLTAWAIYKRRHKAERRLVDAVRAGLLSDPAMEVVTEATQTTVAGRDCTSDQREPS